MAGAGGTAEQLPLPPTSFGNPTAVAEAIKAQLLKNPDVNGIITISTGDADSAGSSSCGTKSTSLRRGRYQKPAATSGGLRAAAAAALHRRAAGGDCPRRQERPRCPCPSFTSATIASPTATTCPRAGSS